MSKTTDRRAKRIERVRNQIMDAAILTISAKGFASATTKEIAATADIAEGTLYNYFKNKDDILMSITERYISYKRSYNINTDVNSMEEFILSIYSSNAGNVASEHREERAVLKALLPEFLTDKKLGAMYHERIVLPFLAEVEKSLLPLQERGIAKNYDVKIISRLIYASTVGFAILSMNGDEYAEGGNHRAKLSKAYVDIIGSGLNLRQ